MGWGGYFRFGGEIKKLIMWSEVSLGLLRFGVGVLGFEFGSGFLVMNGFKGW